MPAAPRLIAIVGAECSGKTTLAEALAAALPGRWIPEYLREFCARAGRTPHRDEQAAIIGEQIAREQASVAQAAVEGAAWVICDSAPIVTALYSVACFADDSLLAMAAAHHACYAATLMTDIDLPWEADGIQRDGPSARADFHRRLTAWFAARAFAPVLIRGEASAREDTAIAALSMIALGPLRPRRRAAYNRPQR